MVWTFYKKIILKKFQSFKNYKSEENCRVCQFYFSSNSKLMDLPVWEKQIVLIDTCPENMHWSSFFMLFWLKKCIPCQNWKSLYIGKNAAGISVSDVSHLKLQKVAFYESWSLYTGWNDGKLTRLESFNLNSVKKEQKIY